MPPSLDTLTATLNSGYQRPMDTVSISTKELPSTVDATQKIIYGALHLADWAQTRNIARNPEKYFENNPVLGKNPHQDKVDAYFALTGLSKILLDEHLPDKLKKPFSDLVIAIEKGAVGNNFNVGMEAKF